ncbi:uncharacterized protein TNCV_2380212 [Trichonephila clavipes]|nr:uncharacterized protein TNCV_2380212 [Trichonephila clavipes]
MAALVSEYTLEFFTLLNARSKKELIEWCMKEGLIASSYECPKCNEQMGLNERKSVVLDGFEWRCRKKATQKACSTITSLSIYGGALSRSLTQRRDFPEFFKSSCYTLPSTWEGSTIRKFLCAPGHIGEERDVRMVYVRGVKKNMRLQKRKGTVDGYEWRCRNQSKDNRHDVVRSVRKGTWFSESKLAITIILRLTRYWFGKSMNEFVMNDLKVNKNMTKLIRHTCGGDLTITSW